MWPFGTRIDSAAKPLVGGSPASFVTGLGYQHPVVHQPEVETPGPTTGSRPAGEVCG